MAPLRHKPSIDFDFGVVSAHVTHDPQGGWFWWVAGEREHRGHQPTRYRAWRAALEQVPTKALLKHWQDLPVVIENKATNA